MLQGLTNKFETEFAQRRQIERELAHLASFAEMDPNCILETDLEGKILYRNIVAQAEFPDLEVRGKARLAAWPLAFLAALRWQLMQQARHLHEEWWQLMQQAGYVLEDQKRVDAVDASAQVDVGARLIRQRVH